MHSNSNCLPGYPGARVDSEVPYYQYSSPKVWKDWTWSERFPGDAELRRYFKHAAEKLEVNDHVKFQENVVDCNWNATNRYWNVITEAGTSIQCRYLIAAAGSSYKKHFPNFSGLRDFKGTLLHAASFPESGIDFTGKRVAVIGQGSLLFCEAAITQPLKCKQVQLAFKSRKKSPSKLPSSMSSFAHPICLSQCGSAR